MKRMRWLALLAVFGLIAAACGSDDSSDDTASSDDTSSSDSSSSGDDDSTEEDGDGGGELLTDVGVSEEAIKLGVITDLTGPFAGLTVPITDGLQAYWESVNDDGGIAGRNVELEIRDAAYDIDAHGTFYDELADDGDEGVVMLQMNLGSPMTAAHREDFVDDQLAAIPLSWNSSWSTENGANIMEFGTNYCIEAMNGIEWMAENRDVTKVAIVGRAGDYGEDGSIGAKKAVEALGLEVVFDGQGQVVPGADPTPVATGIAESGADVVWTTVGPSELGALMGRSAELGYTGLWAGNGPSYNQVLLGTAGLADLIGATYTHFAPLPEMNPDQSPAMKEYLDILTEYRPDGPYLGAQLSGYAMARMAHQGLLAAVENGDLTRQGVVDAMQSTTIDMGGLMADITYGGAPNDIIPRDTFVFSVDPSLYDAEATWSTGAVGSDGLVTIEEGYIGSVAEGFEYEPCFGI